MGNTIERGSLFAAHLSNEIFSKVRGKSSLAKLCGSDPIPFNGIKEFTFSMDKEIDIVAESGAKSNGGATVAPVTIVPIKVEYGARVSDEFLYASEEEAISILNSWTEGFALKLAKGLDIMAFHGVNPRTGNASLVIGNNNFDYMITNEVEYDPDHPDENLDDAVALVQDSDYAVTGMALSTAFANKMAKVKANGVPLYPEFRFGQNPNSFAGMNSDVNNTVAANSNADRAIIGDFANAFKWGIAKNLPLEVIEYGNPDNDAEAGDLKGHNQIYLRSEAYIGWGIMDKDAFARIAVDDEPIITT